ncbi:MAG: mechanosensitive ion channel family protein [Polyangiales bacterium]
MKQDKDEIFDTAHARDRLEVVTDRLSDLYEQGLELLPLLALAVVVVVLFWLLSRVVTSRTLLFRWIDNPFARDLVRQLVRVGVVAIGGLIGLELLDATSLVGAALGAAGVVGLALGFALKDVIQNYVAGLLLSLRQPFGPNDHVVIDGNEGKVTRLTPRATVLLTLDGNHLRLPNALVFTAVILNYTHNPRRRFDFSVGVGVNEDLVRAQTLGVGILEGMQSVMDDPNPFANIMELGDSTVNLHFFAWVDQREHDFLKAQGAAIRLIKTAFDDAEIDMPMPTYRVITAAADAPAPSRSAAEDEAARQEGDTSIDPHLDDQVRAERSDSPDLLRANGEQE